MEDMTGSRIADPVESTTETTIGTFYGKTNEERSQEFMRKRNYTVTIRMNKAEYDLLQNKVKESGQTQQAVVIYAIAGLKIASAEEVEELKKLNLKLAEMLSQLRGVATNINQIARKMNAGGFIPREDILHYLNQNIRNYRKESEKIWQSIRQLISGQILMEQ